MDNDFYKAKRESWLQRAEKLNELTRVEKRKEAAALDRDIKQNRPALQRMERERTRPMPREEKARLENFFAVTQPPPRAS